jgi:hypothetical protein
LVTPAGAAPCSTILTPHDSALDKQDGWNIIPARAKVKDFIQQPAAR